MTIKFGTWQDIPYESLPKTSTASRVNWQTQRLIQEKYPDPTRCPSLEAVIFHGRAVALVRAEDSFELFLDDKRSN